MRATAELGCEELPVPDVAAPAMPGGGMGGMDY
jgi:hypothetical protein